MVLLTSGYPRSCPERLCTTRPRGTIIFYISFKKAAVPSCLKTTTINKLQQLGKEQMYFLKRFKQARLGTTMVRCVFWLLPGTGIIQDKCPGVKSMLMIMTVGKTGPNLLVFIFSVGSFLYSIATPWLWWSMNDTWYHGLGCLRVILPQPASWVLARPQASVLVLRWQRGWLVQWYVCLTVE